MFRDFDDPDSLISTKKVSDGSLEVPGEPGRIIVRLFKPDVEEALPIFIAVYIEGALVDLFSRGTKEV